MMEILMFAYDASGPSIRASVPAMNENGVRLLGATDHETTATLADLADDGDEEAAFVADFLALMVRAEPIIRRRATRDAKPDAVQALANANAREREEIRREKLAHEEAKAAAAAELAALNAEIEAKKSALAAKENIEK